MSARAAILGAAAALAVLVAAGPAAAFDKVLLKDGRLIEGKIHDPDKDGHVAFEIRGMTIEIPHAMVDKHYIEDLEDYVPKNAKEEKNLKKGWVLFEGRWMSKARREQELTKRAEEQEEAIAESRRMADWKNAQVVETPIFKIQSNATKAIRGSGLKESLNISATMVPQEGFQAARNFSPRVMGKPGTGY